MITIWVRCCPRTTAPWVADMFISGSYAMYAPVSGDYHAGETVRGYLDVDVRRARIHAVDVTLTGRASTRVAARV